MAGLGGKAFIALAHAGVGNHGVDVLRFKRGHVGVIVIASVSGDDGMRLAECGYGRDAGQQQGLFAARAIGFGMQHDLVFGIDGGNAGIALDNAVRSGHLGAVVVGAMALEHAAAAADFVVRVMGEPFAQRLGLFLQAGEFTRRTRLITGRYCGVGLLVGLVVLVMTLSSNDGG